MNRALLGLASGFLTAFPAIAQVLTASAVTVTFQASAGGLQSVPGNTPVATPPLRVADATTAGGNAAASCSSSLEMLANRVAFATWLDVSSSAPPTASVGPLAQCVGDVTVTLTAARPVWVKITIDWLPDGLINLTGAATVVDVFDDGQLEVNTWAFPAHVVVPVAFGPGAIRIKTRTSLTCQANFEMRSRWGTARLDVTVDPDAGPLTFAVTPNACGAQLPPVLAARADFERQVEFRLAGLPPAPARLGVLVIGGQATSLPLPLPPQCLLLTDVVLARLLSPAELTGAPVICSPHGLATPFLLHVQALMLDLNSSTLLASNRMSIGSP